MVKDFMFRPFVRNLFFPFAFLFHEKESKFKFFVFLKVFVSSY
jgi:hypothetical protein